MGKITLVVEGTTVGTVATGGGVSMPYEVSETDSARLIAAMADYYKDTFVTVDGPGPRMRGVPYTPTINQVVKAWFDDVVAKALSKTAEYEKRQVPVTPITVTGG